MNFLSIKQNHVHGLIVFLKRQFFTKKKTTISWEPFMSGYNSKTIKLWIQENTSSVFVWFHSTSDSLKCHSSLYVCNRQFICLLTFIVVVFSIIHIPLLCYPQFAYVHVHLVVLNQRQSFLLCLSENYKW